MRMVFKSNSEAIKWQNTYLVTFNKLEKPWKNAVPVNSLPQQKH